MKLIRRYALSTIVTFLTGFAIVIVGEIDSLTIDAFKDGTLVGLLFAAVRAGLKAAIEMFLAYQTAQR